MSAKRPYVSIALAMGDAARRRLQSASLLDSDYKIQTRDDALLIPLSRHAPRESLRVILLLDNFETGETEFQPAHPRPMTLAEALKSKLDEEELKMLPRSYDLIGDIAVLEIPKELSHHERTIGEAFLAVHKNFATVLGKRGAISGVIRTREYELLAGADKTETVHTEYGCRIAVDLARAYFSPRLLEEHHRVAELVKDDETVIDMFTGVGPFAIHIAARRMAHVYAIDINPDAISLLEHSMRMNRLIGTITPVVADAGLYVPANFVRRADRVIMNHPKGASEFIALACMAVRDGGTVHYYDFAGGQSPEDEFREKVEKLVRKSERSVREIESIRRVRDSAPREFQMAADIVIGR